jgi:hypothetical protein
MFSVGIYPLTSVFQEEAKDFQDGSLMAYTKTKKIFDLLTLYI